MTVELRSAAQQAFDRLSLPSYLTLERLVDIVAEARGKRIKIVETAKLNGRKICGLWVPLPTIEMVFHAVPHSPLHRQQLILHELSHMLLRHDEQDEVSWRGTQIFQEISGEFVEKALARGDFQSDMEVTAEYLADLLAAALRQSPREIHSFEEVFE